ncbi:hypothetical protein ANT2_0801 [plant metagenome]|uniref:Uncharacterized protein n=1 Tax=plant metagenome TaxID=1297885 RepID=A0A484R4R7_9ZZZZ
MGRTARTQAGTRGTRGGNEGRHGGLESWAEQWLEPPCRGRLPAI